MEDQDRETAAPASAQPGADPAEANVAAQIEPREPLSAQGAMPVGGVAPVPVPAPVAVTTAADAAPTGRAPTPCPSQTGHEQTAAALRVPHFVAPSSYLRFRTSHGTAMATVAPAAAEARKPSTPSPLDKEQAQGLKAIRHFLKVRTSYDVLPLSFRLIVLDTDLLIKKSLNILTQNGTCLLRRPISRDEHADVQLTAIVSAPLWDSDTSRFAGILTSTDFINVIQYYCQFPDEISKLGQFRLSSLRDIEKAIGAIPIETVSVHPSRPLYEACRRMLKTRARRIPLVDVDDETGRETVISVITQYRILKFIAVNNEHNTVMLKKCVREVNLGSYTNLATVHMNSTVLDAIHMMVDRNISCVPVVDAENRVLNAFEAIDVIPCIKGGAYEELDGTVGEALCKRPDDSPGIYTCGEGDRLDSIFDTIRKSRVHRLIVVDDDNKLKGIISLSDILKYVLLYGDEDAGGGREKAQQRFATT
ncbi:Nuclear protein SNF4 [Tolypocladium capitatum]|uniref:Nuclear protein SNF4 n=1 Tax=Tolypocladium capitatum TaxID=45235 RepID=A0A2K3QP42_9HYPO|nr:Nuclear protein SNF4 [Tolypocladium capitatum]